MSAWITINRIFTYMAPASRRLVYIINKFPDNTSYFEELFFKLSLKFSERDLLDLMRIRFSNYAGHLRSTTLRINMAQAFHSNELLSERYRFSFRPDHKIIISSFLSFTIFAI